MPRAFSYIRFSSLQQGEGSSTERQEALIADWLEKNPSYTLAARKIDRGRSAFKGEHKKHHLGLILKLIDDGETQEGDVLLVEAMDRLSREEPTDALEQFIKIVKSGLTIITLEDGQRYDKETAANGNIYGLLGKLQQANAYSKSLSRRIKASMNARRSKAEAGLEFGLRRSSWLDTKTHKLVEPQAEIVRSAIRFYLTGLGTRAVAAKIREDFKHVEGISKLNATTLARWFDDPALIGQWGGTRGNPVVIENAFEALISIDYFVLLQSARKQRRKHIPSPQLNDLSGLVKCSCCGASYNFRTQKAKPTLAAPKGSEELKNKPNIIYGACSNYLKNKACSNNTSLPYEVFFELHKEAIQDHLYGLAFEQVSNRRKSKELKELEQTLNKSSSNYSFLLDQFDEYGLEETKLRLDKKAKEIKALQAKINDIKSIFEPENAGSEFIDPNYKNLLNEAINEEAQRLIDNPIVLRETLKAQGYRLHAEGKLIKFENITYEVLRRSQLNLCYLVKRTEPEYIGDKIDENVSYLALAREGTGFGSKLLDNAPSLAELEDLLNSQ